MPAWLDVLEPLSAEASPPTIWWLHGSGVDRHTWMLQRRSPGLRRARLVVPDRPGYGAWGPGANDTVGEQASALAAEFTRLGPAFVVGSSFGAVVALELMATLPTLVRGAVLCEPPLPAGDCMALRQELTRMEALADEQGPAAGAEAFLRAVTGPRFDRIPVALRAQAASLWPSIRADAAAVLSYEVPWDALRSSTAAVLLLQGEHSGSYFAASIDLVARQLPQARRVVVAGAGHMMHAEAATEFNRVVAEFVGLGP